MFQIMKCNTAKSYDIKYCCFPLNIPHKNKFSFSARAPKIETR